MKKQIYILMFLCGPVTAESSNISIKGGEVEFGDSQMPALQELENIVLRHLGINQEMEETMAVRARRAAWLPTVTFYGDLDQKHGTAEKKGQNISDSLLEKGERDFGAGVRLTFSLSNLVYNSAELELKTLALKKFDKREQVIQNLHKTYFRYLRLKNSLDAQKGHSALLKLEMLEVLATLNSLSGGVFSTMPSLQ